MQKEYKSLKIQVLLLKRKSQKKEEVGTQQGGGNILGTGSSTPIVPKDGPNDDDGVDYDDESGNKRDSDPMEKVDD